MRVLLFSRYGRLGASSRVRFYQYLPFLQERGIEVDVAPLLDDSYLTALYSQGRRSPASVASGYLARIRGLLDIRNYDLVWLEGELLPWLPAVGERLLASLGVPYVVDYDDAIFHRYDLNENAVVRRLLAGKIDAVMRSAALVVCGNRYLMDRARRAGARRVEYLPTVVDLDQYEVQPGNPDGEPFTIGWIGSPATAHYLDRIRGAVEDVAAHHAVRVVLVGSGPSGGWNAPVEVRRWSEETEAQSVAEFDVGVMPLADGPWERGKCGYKLIQYMASGRPVIASAVGANTSIVEQGETGFLASTEEEWTAALERLRTDAGLRQQMGRAGRRRVEAEFSLQGNAPRLASLLWSLVPDREARNRLPVRGEFVDNRVAEWTKSGG